MSVNLQRKDFKPLSTTRLPNGMRELNREFRIEVDDVLHIVPKGFNTDFSSYPWFFRVIVRFDKVDIAGVVHDWLYYKGNLSRSEADIVWRKLAMAGEHHANALQAWLSWLGLRIGGWIIWNRYRKGKGSSFM